MKINLQNYEQYILDYIENNLSPDLRHEFDAFLLLHPEINEELLQLDEVTILSQNEISLDKSNLYWTNTLSNSKQNDSLIAFMEGDLNADEARLLEIELLQNKKMQNQFKLFQQTKLQSDLNVFFPNKKILYRRKLGVATYVYSMAAAAVVLFFLWLPLRQEQGVSTNKLSSMALIENYKPISKELVKHQATKISFDKKSQLKKVLTNENTTINEAEDFSMNSSSIEILSTKNKALNNDFRVFKNIDVLHLNNIGQSMVEVSETKQNKIWLFAEKSVESIGRLTKRKIDFENEYTQAGKLSKLVVSTENFKFERSFGMN
jgi:hypothetical protein